MKILPQGMTGSGSMLGERCSLLQGRYSTMYIESLVNDALLLQFSRQLTYSVQVMESLKILWTLMHYSCTSVILYA